jgi:hypothetical protein
MEIEEEMAAFGETQVWITCDLCGRVYGGPGITELMVRVEEANICVGCLTQWGTSAEGGAVEAHKTCLIKMPAA